MGEKGFKDKTVLLEKLRAGLGGMGRWRSSPHSPYRARTGEWAPQIKHLPEVGKRRLGRLLFWKLKLESGLQVQGAGHPPCKELRLLPGEAQDPTSATPLPIAVNHSLRPVSDGKGPIAKIRKQDVEGSCGLLKGA